MNFLENRFFLAAALALCLSGSAALSAQEPPAETEAFVVVVHPDNPIDSIENGVLGKIFRKRLKRWPDWDDGGQPMPVDQEERSQIRGAFTTAVHGKRISAIKSYWQRQIFSGRDNPPPEKSSDSQVLTYVRAHPTAVGYVTADADLGDGIKVLEVEY